MAEIIRNLLVNTLTRFDEAFLLKWKNVLTVYTGDTKGRSTVVPARMQGIDEEVQGITYPHWVINPLTISLDLRRYNDQVNTSALHSVSGVSSVDRTPPDQPYLLTYIVNGYSQDARMFREMQEFAMRTFPVNSFLTVQGENHHVESRGSTTRIDTETKEYTLQLTYQVWALLELTDITNVKTVYNTVTIGFLLESGRYEL